MDTRSRRRVDIALLTGGAAVAGVVALGAAFVGGKQEEVGRYWTVAAVGDDGSAQITEVIDYDFGLNQKRGIFRWVPGLDPAAPITVSSPDAPDDVQVTQTFETNNEGDSVAGANIRIGEPSTTITGEHRYVIEYPLPGVRQGEVVDWEAVGTGWDVGMGEVEVHLVAPFNIESPLCVYGSAGSTATCVVHEVEPGHLVATVDGLGANEGVSIEGTQGAALPVAPVVPEAPNDPPADDSTNPFLPAGVALGSTAVAAAGATRLRAEGGTRDRLFGRSGRRRLRRTSARRVRPVAGRARWRDPCHLPHPCPGRPHRVPRPSRPRRRHGRPNRRAGPA